MLLISTFDYHSFHKLAIVIFGVSLFLLVFLLICRYAHIESIANWEGDATRWLNFGFVSFQPSEIAKFALIVLFAHMISQNLDRMDTFRYGVVPYVAIMGLVAALIFLESHLSATLIILALGAIMMFVGGTKPGGSSSAACWWRRCCCLSLSPRAATKWTASASGWTPFPRIWTAT